MRTECTGMCMRGYRRACAPVCVYAWILLGMLVYAHVCCGCMRAYMWVYASVLRYSIRQTKVTGKRSSPIHPLGSLAVSGVRSRD